MIYITGDTHGALDIGKLNTKNFPEQRQIRDFGSFMVNGTGWNEGQE